MSVSFSGTSTFSSLTPLASPFWSTSPDPKCGAVITDPDTNIQFCCNGLLIDTTQPMAGAGANNHPYYFENLRCCSGVGVALGDVTTCGGASQVALTEQLSTKTISGSTTVTPVTAASTSDMPIMATEVIATASAPSGSLPPSMPTQNPMADQPNATSATWKGSTQLALWSMALSIILGSTLSHT